MTYMLICLLTISTSGAAVGEMKLHRYFLMSNDTGGIPNQLNIKFCTCFKDSTRIKWLLCHNIFNS